MMLRSITLFFAISLNLSYVEGQTSPECVAAAQVLNDKPEVNQAHAQLLQTFEMMCMGAGMCDHTIDSIPSSEINPSDVDVKEVLAQGPIKGTVTADFGGDFTSNPSYTDYYRACTANGGRIGCTVVDGAFAGEAGADYGFGGEAGKGIPVDITMNVDYFPICLPKECDNETDLLKVLEIEFRDAMLAAPEFQNELDNPQTAALLKLVTFSQVCALSGLETCTLTVANGDCHDARLSGSTLSRNSGFAAAVAGATAGALLALN